MSDINRARAMFPLLPAEVFDAWLLPVIEHQGWPFTSVDDSIYFDNWPGLFADMPLTEWADVTWTKDILEKDAMRLVPRSVELVMQVAVHFLTSSGTDIGRQIANSHQRSGAVREFIESTGSFPGFITAFRHYDGRLQLLDGHHRLGACWSLQSPNSIPTWIGTAPR